MSENRDEASGQFAPAEPLTGRAGLEHEAGYRQMPDPEKTNDGIDLSVTEAGEIRSAIQVDEAPTVEIFFQDGNGERLNADLNNGPVEATTIEQAAAALTAFREANTDNAAKSISNDLAAEIDQLRGDALKGDPSDADGAEATTEGKAEPKPAKTTSEPDPFDAVEGLDPETREALKRPQVRQFLEANDAETRQTVESLKAAVTQNQQFGQAAILTLVPEFGNYQLDQWPAVANALKQSGDPRGQQVENLLLNVQALNQRQQVLQQYQQVEQQQQFENHVRTEDARLVEMVGSKKAADEATNALVSYLTSNGVQRNDMVNVFLDNPVLRTAEARQTIWKAAKYDQMMQATKPTPHRPVPPVQRPGNGGARVSSDEGRLADLSRQFANSKGDKQIRLAAQISEIRRNRS